jgi:peroxiredoxin Q/BCP
MPIAEGQLAPDFTLPTDTGESLTLSSLRGQWVVLYGYPKDDTSGCTTQACEFRDAFPRFSTKKSVILGISPDPVKSHQKFKAKYELPFTLLADTEKVALQAYDIWKEKSMYGKKYMGVERTTFVIDPAGRIVKVFEKVKPAGHAAEVEAVIGG